MFNYKEQIEKSCTKQFAKEDVYVLLNNIELEVLEILKGIQKKSKEDIIKSVEQLYYNLI